MSNKIVNCVHWRPCLNRDGGCCKKELYGGRPSYNICNQVCRQRIRVSSERRVFDWGDIIAWFTNWTQLDSVWLSLMYDLKIGCRCDVWRKHLNSKSIKFRLWLSGVITYLARFV